jgi:hypothetical protein
MAQSTGQRQAQYPRLLTPDPYERKLDGVRKLNNENVIPLQSKLNQAQG